MPSKSQEEQFCIKIEFFLSEVANIGHVLPGLLKQDLFETSLSSRNDCYMKVQNNSFIFLNEVTLPYVSHILSDNIWHAFF